MSSKIINSLQERNLKIREELGELKRQNVNLELQLASVYNSKAFKVWQRYNRYKRTVLDYYFKDIRENILSIKDILKSHFYQKVLGPIFYLRFKIIENNNKYSLIVVNKISMPQISILVPTYGSVENLNRLLQSIKKYNDPIRYELLICNDNPKMQEVIEDWSSINFKLLRELNCTLYTSSNNLGFVSSINYLAKKAKGKYILLLNDDTEVFSNNCFTSLVDDMEKDNKIGVTGSLLLFPDMCHIQHAGMYPFRKIDGKIYNYHYYKYFNRNYPQIEKKNVPMVTGAALCIRKKIFQAIGGMNPRYLGAGGFDDSELCNEVIKQGYMIRLCPESRLIHHEGMTIKKVGRQHSINFVNNLLYYNNKWSRFLAKKYPEYT